MSSIRKDTPLVFGAPPRANLLPPEVGLAVKARATRRGLAASVVAALVVVGLGFGLATVHLMQSDAQLNTETERTATLLADQGKYSEVRSVNSAIKSITAARQVGSSTSIDWQSYFQSIQASLPAGTAITTFSAKSGSPLVEFPQPTLPLQGERLAELNFIATSTSLPDVQAWLDGLAKLKGFVDALPGTVTLSAGGTYQVGITMHINELALDQRFASTAVKKAAADAAQARTDASATASANGGN